MIDRAEFAAVNGDRLSAKKVEFLAQQSEFPADLLNRLRVVLAKIGDGLKSGCNFRNSQSNSLLRYVAFSSRWLKRILFRKP